jgi:hypothetical protein
MKEIKQEITGSHNIQVSGDFIKTEKVTRKNTITPNYDINISQAQAKQIKDKVNEMAASVPKEKISNEYRKIWTSLNNKFKLTSYLLMTKEQFDDAMKFLNKMDVSYYRNKLKKNNNEEWRKKTITAIRARANNLRMNRDDFYEYVKRVLLLKKPILSITELSDTRLKQLYTKIFSVRY